MNAFYDPYTSYFFLDILTQQGYGFVFMLIIIPYFFTVSYCRFNKLVSEKCAVCISFKHRNHKKENVTLLLIF